LGVHDSLLGGKARSLADEPAKRKGVEIALHALPVFDEDLSPA
jgi:hypothetical protein